MKRGSRKKSVDDAILMASDNLFADFGLPQAVEKNAKVQLAFAINTILEKKSFGTQQAIAKVLGAKQPEVSALRNYKLRIFSLERLVEFLMALDNDVEITIRPARAKGARTRVINRAA